MVSDGRGFRKDNQKVREKRNQEKELEKTRVLEWEGETERDRKGDRYRQREGEREQKVQRQRNREIKLFYRVRKKEKRQVVRIRVGGGIEEKREGMKAGREGGEDTKKAHADHLTSVTSLVAFKSILTKCVRFLPLSDCKRISSRFSLRDPLFLVSRRFRVIEASPNGSVLLFKRGTYHWPERKRLTLKRQLQLIETRCGPVRGRFGRLQRSSILSCSLRKVWFR